MKYYFECGDGKVWLMLNRGSWRWVNYDLPNIYDQDDNLVIEVCFPGYETYIYDNNNKTYDDLVRFIDQSDKAFHKHFSHYEWCGEYTGHMVTRIN